VSINCWIWDADPIIFPIWGPFQVRWYGLMFLFVFWWGYLLLNWQMKRGERGPDLASQFVNWGVTGILVGAWFAHRFFYEWDRVVENPLYLIDVRGGLAGLSSHGATVGLMAALMLFGRKHRIPAGEMLDRCTFGAAMAGILVRTGNFFNSEIIGTPTDGSWGVCFPRIDSPMIPRHPSQLYEAGAGALLLATLLVVDRLAGREKRPIWLLTGTYLAVYFLIRFVIEFFKEHQTTVSGLTMGQRLSIPMFFVGLACIAWALTHRGQDPPPPAEIENDIITTS